MDGNKDIVSIKISDIEAETLYDNVILALPAREYLELFAMMTKDIAATYPPIRNLK
ncbi:MAG: hypothetical protein IJV71_05870 [Lachnospiraceae bacterium]|nr:hypothetical protein [Lachnospiraceae bacterium]